MKCPYCHKERTSVSNSRKAGEAVWRRRVCGACGSVFTTQEFPAYDSLFVVKRNLTRKRFIYEKLLVSIFHALEEGKDRDLGDEALKARIVTKKVVATILVDIKSTYISSKDIIRTTYDILQKESSYAALRYMMYSDYRMKVLQAKR